MNKAAQIMRLTPSDALSLYERARQGDADAAREYVLYGAWRKIKTDKVFPRSQQPKVFLNLAKNVKINVEYV